MGIQHKRNLSRFVKWPRYVRLQRQKKILQTRLKVPPSINQFNRSLRRDQLNELKSLLSKYKPLTKKQKQDAIAKEAKSGDAPAVDGNIYLQFGLNQKNATCVALTGVRREDLQKFQKLQSTAKSQFNDNAEALRTWGGGIMGLKTRTKLRLREEVKLAAKIAKTSM